MSLNFEETKEWAIQVFLELQTVLWLSIGLTLTSLEDYIKNEVEPTLRDDYSEKRLFLSYRSQPLFSICMAPCYSDKHPRYAPSPIVVVTWAYDVGQAHKNNQPKVTDSCTLQTS
jgi:FPC/CPF motif-containing protein YcgG